MVERVPKYNAAVVQAASFPDDPLKSAAKAASLIREAASRGARLAVFPEAFIGGYPKGASFGAPVGMRKPEGREAFRQYYDAAIDLDGEAVETITAATAETGLFAVIGCIERDGGTLYCTALFFDGAKGLVGKHRKLMPTAADDRDTWLPSMQHVALEGRCFVLTACQHITRKMYRDGHKSALGDYPDTVMMRGGSAIVDPLGRVLAGPDFTGETILYAEIDFDQIARGKFDFDATGHYARPDVFQLIVDDRPKPAVSNMGDLLLDTASRAVPAK